MSKYIFSLIFMCCILCMPSTTISEQIQPDVKGKLLYLKNHDVWSFDPISKNHKQITHSHKITNYSISSDGKKLVYVSNNNMFIQNILSNKSVFLTNIEADMSSPSLSPANDTI